MKSPVTTGHVVGVFFAAFLFAFSVAVETPSVLLLNAEHMLASVGVSASIQPNPYNSVAEQLATKENTLSQREAEVVRREQAIASREHTPLGQAGMVSMGVSALLALLLGINFYLDYRRRNKVPTVQYSVTLK